MAARVGVAVAEHVARGVEGGFAAFSHGSRGAAARPARGDRIASYAPRESAEGPAMQAFVALGTVIDDAPEERDFGAFRPWVRRVDREAVTSATVRPLLDRLSFVTDRRGWGMAFRRGLFRVPAEDFAVIEGALRDG